MQEAAERGDGGMLALIGDREPALELAAEHELTVANDNAPEQLVVAGPADALDAARRDARSAGLRALRLPVAGAFHSPEMEPAVAGFREALAEVEFREPRIPVVSCATAREFTSPRSELADAIVRPVRWRQTMRALRDRGVERFSRDRPRRRPHQAGQAQPRTRRWRAMLEAAVREQADAPQHRTLRPAAIAGVAMSVPARVVDNEPIAARLGIDPGWIVARTGVHERRVLSEGEDAPRHWLPMRRRAPWPMPAWSRPRSTRSWWPR